MKCSAVMLVFNAAAKVSIAMSRLSIKTIVQTPLILLMFLEAKSLAAQILRILLQLRLRKNRVASCKLHCLQLV